MSFKNVRAIPSPEAIRSLIPINEELAKIKKDNDRQIADVITGKDKRFIVIVGPCSADDEEAVLEYMNKLKEVRDKVNDKLLIVPRVYTGKPRTTGEGYKGMMHQPDPTKEPNMLEGILAIRKMFIRVIEETSMPISDEMLYPSNLPFVEDLLSYIAIGARSVENQQHRLTASGIDCAVGMKNPTSGDLTVMMNAMLAAQHPHTFIYRGWEAQSFGNPYAHAILRGYVNRQGVTHPNYHYEDLVYLLELYGKWELRHPGVIIDTNHANSGKDPFQQPRIIREVLASRRWNSEVAALVKGFMVESYLEDGCQSVGGGCYGKSITDACLGWEKTERLILEMADLL